MDSNLPVPRSEADDASEHTPIAARRPISVAYLPLALVTFLVVAFAIAAWTFLSAAG